ncbi:DAK2 domain-containing protein [Faecalitalea cylindroides]|uniref:DAK2 domain-containing protein n=1 Tax=Faecalitalea cylindroides TaxID=39483 RepID=UPI000B3A9CB2|nr:DAK2 domain-containing protein [Faecalitalea cylindroides]MDB7952389.1 DAK2 domain-containing protein [Faecalitalea cylindroides]MDB7958983.1 DAK2 domain-containing protein [Faecalitalea cylindroides]MDB7960840.1 DAK2 domain-containing protein [Faecalitalea cylindroides]MDB7962911.1 DAK2 domain-containing protein [Faecalitalea cylindroides]MDB7964756.1 DAK2 domain-containing protein [Faecalitalea cylindroides]
MERISGKLFKDMLASGMNNLTNHSAEVDSLNVFPVPDGDTGTNMSLTFSSGVNDAIKVEEDHVGKVAKVLSRGLLMGARGNSGVITSQIFRGFFQSVEHLEDMDALQLAQALVNGSRVAYRAVMRPVEGTILTVVREAADYTYAYTVTEEITDCIKVMEKMVLEANESLLRTPELLPVLAEVGVVDSGGKGLCIILEGFLSAMKGEVIAPSNDASSYDSAQTKIEGGEEEFGFCTEFILHLTPTGIKHFSEEDFKNELATIGNSIVCVQDDDLVKVHVHTLEPQTAIKMGKRRGRFMKLKIENMQEQHDNILEKEQEEEVVAEHKKYAIITVAPGKGIDAMFKELRADIVVGGGQTMNPSTEDFVSAIGKVNADHIIILPNNSNIVLAANQACQVCEDKDIHVLPTKTIPQGLSACIMFNPEVDIEDNLAEMQEAIDHVKSGEVTYAIKDTTYEGLEIKKDEYMGIFGKAIVVSDPDMMASTKALLDKMLDEDSELVTLIYGDTATLEQAEEIAEYIEDTSDAEVEIHEGNQPVYSFIIGVE